MAVIPGVAAVAQAVSSVFTFASQLFRYNHGTDTKEEERTKAEADKWVQEFSQALQSGDIEHANSALDQLRKLRDKAVAAKP